MWFPTIVIVVVGITQIESRNCSELLSVTNLKIVRKDSSLAIEWTASNSTEECLEGYELCLSAISFENTNITCYNVSKNETSLSSNDDIYYCVEYKATVTVLGADSLRSRSSSGSLQAFPSTTIDPLVNLTKTANSSSIAITVKTLSIYPYCRVNSTNCLFDNSNGKRCSSMSGGSGEMNFNIYNEPACVRYRILLNVTIYSLQVATSLSKSDTISTKSINSTMIQSVSVDNVTASGATISWEPVYKDSPCALHYSVCYLEDDSAGSPACYTMINTSETAIKLPYLKRLTNYTVNVSAVFLDETSSSVVTTSFRTSGAVTVVVSSMMLTMILFIASL